MISLKEIKVKDIKLTIMQRKQLADQWGKTYGYIKCDCNDPSCEKKGYEGEVANHIEDCSCSICHRHYSKLR
jgi:hypothetical protein